MILTFNNDLLYILTVKHKNAEIESVTTKK